MSPEPSFQDHWERVQQLERWRELAIRPTREECHADDQQMLEQEQDNLAELQRRCLQVRDLMNQRLPPQVSLLEHQLVCHASRIPNSGKGLFYKPVDSERAGDETPIPVGEILCYYYGHIHDFHSTKQLTDTSYLMLVGGNVFVDPRLCPDIKARYINDPLNEALVNCKFVPEPMSFRSAVVSTREIHPQTELFISYGDFYWSQQSIKGTVFVGSSGKRAH